MFFTAVRVSELCNIHVAEVDLENCKISSTRARAVRIATFCLANPSPRPFGRTSPLILKPLAFPDPMQHEVFHPANRADRQRVCRAGGREGHAAYFPASGHHLAYPALGLADAELQLITGHARRETLAIYQHVALDGQLEGKYQEAMKKVDL